MKLKNSSPSLLGAALAFASLAACGDSNTTVTPDGGTPDAFVEPLVPGIAMITDIDWAVDVTSDGRTALLWKANGELYFYDVVSGQLETKTTLDTTELQNQQPHAMSDLGHIAAGYGVDPEAAGLWDATNGWKKLKSPLSPCPNAAPINSMTGAAFDVSPDGAYAVGMLWDPFCKSQAFLWKDTGGDGRMIPLQKLGRGPLQGERATVVSADGKVAAGYAPDLQGPGYEVDRTPAVWREDGTGFLLDPFVADGSAGEVTAITPDGRIVAGHWATSDPSWSAFGGKTGFTWSEDTGVVRFSSSTPGSEDIFANAMSADGKNVYGLVNHYVDPTDFFSAIEIYAYVWSKDKGLRNLQAVATAAGITVPANHVLTNVMAVSADGRVVIGNAQVPPDDPNNGFPTPKLFVLVLPAGAL